MTCLAGTTTMIKPKVKQEPMSILYRLKDGTEVDCVPSDWTDTINMVGAKLVTDDRDIIAHLKDSPFTIGDCIVDAWQGVYWMLKQSYLFGDVPVKKFKYNGAAIVVGSGPSLDLYVDKLKQWKGKALIISAYSTANTLLDHGIEPDIVVPIERTNFSIPGVKIPGFVEQKPLPNTYCAGLPVVPNEHLRYGKRMLLCSMDSIFKWAGCEGEQMFIGSYSGAAALAVAKEIATGPIYLVGNDLVGGHCDGYTLPEEIYPKTETLACVDGKRRPAPMIRHRVANELGIMSKGKEVYQCAPEGALIAGTTYAELPNAVDGSAELSCNGIGDAARVERLNLLRQGLSDQLEQSVARAFSVMTVKDMNCSTLFDAEYYGIGLCLFRSLFAQMSMESRFGMKDADVLEWAKEAYRSSIEGIIGGADALRLS